MTAPADINEIRTELGAEDPEIRDQALQRAKDMGNWLPVLSGCAIQPVKHAGRYVVNTIAVAGSLNAGRIGGRLFSKVPQL